MADGLALACCGGVGVVSWVLTVVDVPQWLGITMHLVLTAGGVVILLSSRPADPGGHPPVDPPADPDAVWRRSPPGY